MTQKPKSFQAISFSAKTDQNWLNKYNQVVNYLIQQQIQQIQSLGQLSSIISQTSNEISDANYQAWQQTQIVNDRLASRFFKQHSWSPNIQQPIRQRAQLIFHLDTVMHGLTT